MLTTTPDVQYSARIFVVDDDPVIANLLSIMLKKLGHQVEAFNSGAAALEAVRRNPPTLVMTDLTMDGMHGFQLLNEIKQASPDVGVIIVTGSASLDDALRAIRSGALDYVTKPIRLENLSEVVKRTLRFAQVEHVNRQYVAELAARDEKLRHELSLARTIQNAMLPSEPPKMAGIECGFVFVPSHDIGGDLFDFIQLSDTELGILIADISGHGVPAALLSAIFKVLAGEVLRQGVGPSEGFRQLHRRLAKTFPTGHFASSFYGVLNTARKTLTWCKAAQEPVLLLRPGQPVQMLEKGGPLLGLFDPDLFGERPYPEHVLELQSGDTLFLFTDGVVEVKNEAGEQLTIDGLLGWLEQDVNLPPRDLVERIHSRTLVHSGSLTLEDDLTALAVRVL